MCVVLAKDTLGVQYSTGGHLEKQCARILIGIHWICSVVSWSVHHFFTVLFCHLFYGKMVCVCLYATSVMLHHITIVRDLTFVFRKKRSWTCISLVLCHTQLCPLLWVKIIHDLTFHVQLFFVLKSEFFCRLLWEKQFETWQLKLMFLLYFVFVSYGWVCRNSPLPHNTHLQYGADCWSWLPTW